MSVTAVTLGGSADNFVMVADYSAAAGGYGQGADIWYDTLCAGGQTVIAVSGTNLGWTYGGIAVFEFETDGNEMTVDQVSSHTDGVTNWTSGTTGTTTKPDEILIGAGCIFNSPYHQDPAWTVTVVNTFSSAAYQIVSSAGDTRIGDDLERAGRGYVDCDVQGQAAGRVVGSLGLRRLGFRGIGVVPTGVAPGSASAANALAAGCGPERRTARHSVTSAQRHRHGREQHMNSYMSGALVRATGTFTGIDGLPRTRGHGDAERPRVPVTSPRWPTPTRT